MKKIIALTLLTILFSTSVFAGSPLTNNTPSNQGAAVSAGSTQAIADNATNPVVRFSTGVIGVINFPTPDANNLVASYVLFTKHYKGSKVFGTANDSTNIYWSASPAKAAAPYLVAADYNAGVTTATAFPTGTGWTAY